MKILFFDLQVPDLLVDNGRSTGGTCVRQYALSKGLIALGHEVGFITWRGANEYVGGSSDIELVDTTPRKGGLPILKVATHYFMPAFRAVNSFEPDVVIMKGSSVRTGIMAIVGKLLHTPVACLVTNDKDADERYKSDSDWITRLSYKYVLAHTKLIICQNHYQANSLRTKKPDKEYLVLHNPYFHDGELLTLKKRRKRRYIAWVGVFSKQKNLSALCQIVERLPEVSFKIAGSFRTGTMSSGDSSDPETTAAVERLRKCKNVDFVGFLGRREVVPFLSDAYLLLSVSHYEGFSNTFLESFAAGTPVVTRRAIDPDGIIAANRIGRVVDEYDGLVGAIRDVMTTDDYESMATRCQSYLTNNHDYVRIAETLSTALAAAKK